MTAQDFPPLQILLAEDNPGDVRLIREAFREHDLLCNLHVVNDGEKAMGFLSSLAEAPESCPDLILLDLNLPKTDGRTLLKRIKEMPQVRQVPVVILSSSDSPNDRFESERLGANCFVRKPSTFEEFMRIGAIAKGLAVPQR